MAASPAARAEPWRSKESPVDRPGGHPPPQPGKGGPRGSHRLSDRPEETLTDVVAKYEREGFKGQFAARPGGAVLCFKCRKESDAGSVALMAMHRLEGASDPGEEQAVAALQCPSCGTKGTLALVYGPGASPEDGMVLKRLPDARGATGIRPGV